MVSGDQWWRNFRAAERKGKMFSALTILRHGGTEVGENEIK